MHYPSNCPFCTETGLYAFGARYLNPVTGMWISADPALLDGSFLPVAPTSDEARKKNSNLPGMGGVYNAFNFGTYSYSQNNPVRFDDPNGEAINLVAALIGAGAGAIICGGIAAIQGRNVWAAAAGGAVAGAVAGLTMGGSLAVTLAAGAVSGAAGGTTERLLSGEKVTPGTVITDAAVGTASAGIARGAGKVIQSAANSSGSAAKSTGSLFKDVTAAGSRLPNRETNIAPQEFIDNLVDSGFAKSLSKDGQVTILSKGNTTYSVYQKATSTGGPSALKTVDGKAVLKIRLEGTK